MPLSPKHDTQPLPNSARSLSALPDGDDQPMATVHSPGNSSHRSRLLAFLQRESGFRLYGYVILENHLHLIAASPDLSRDMQRFKAYTAKQIVGHLQKSGEERMLALLALLKRPHKIDSDYQIWEEGSHPQIIENEDVMRQKLDYIHLNPVKRGYVDLPIHWRYSSARNYAGLEGLIEVNRDW